MGPELGRRTLARGAVAQGAVALAALGAGSTSARAADTNGRVAAILPELVARLQDGLGPWHVPGAALGVVVGQDIVLARGLGTKRAGGSDPVDAQTVFQIGSTTKAFTATAEAILVDRGKLGWMDRVIDHNPDFRLLDPWVTREFRIIDLLAQRSGLRAYLLDVLWVLGYTPEQLVAGLRYAAPVSSFRTTFAYQNILHSVAGRIVARLAGAADWQDALQQLILQPLGMAATTMSAAGLLAADNRATGHAFYDGTLTPLPPMATFPYGPGPAGGINSSLADMLIWLKLLIGRGETGGHRLLGAAALETTWKPRVEINPTDAFPWPWQAYASGWIVRQTERGTAIWHNGGSSQFVTHVGFVPGLDVGLVILTNEGTNKLADATGFWFYDRLLGNEPVDYAAQSLATYQTATEAMRLADRRPSEGDAGGPIRNYVGTYQSEFAGEAQVEAGPAAGLTVTLKMPGTRFGLEPWDGDVFVMTSDEPALSASLRTGSPLLVQFQRDARGKVVSWGFDGEPDVVFARAAPA